MNKLALHWKIIIAIVLGAVVGALSISFEAEVYVIDWIAPIGKLFIKLLKLVAVPLVLFSLIDGVSSISEVGKLKRIGLTTALSYLSTTVLAISVGLIAVNLVKPWRAVDNLSMPAAENVPPDHVDSALAMLVKYLPPDQVLSIVSSGGTVLKVILFSVVFGVILLFLKGRKANAIRDFVGKGNKVMLKMVGWVMWLAPFGAFALIAEVVIKQAAGDPNKLWDLMLLLGSYSLTVIAALLFLGFLVYPGLLYLFGINARKLYKAIFPAQLLAFSTSSSAATLPLTMKRVNEKTDIKEEVSGFVLPLGATINMDGTSCYQAVAAVFIANALGYPLDWIDQLSIVLTATMASIGSAAVPGAGMVMLTLVLTQLSVPVEGIALIVGVDRLLDMFRTVINVTGDVVVSSFVNKVSQKKSKP